MTTFEKDMCGKPEWWEGQQERDMTTAEKAYWKPSEFRADKTQVNFARRLNEHGIPCVFWGPGVQNIYGSNDEYKHVNFWVVPDELFDAALKCLGGSWALEPCTRGGRCYFDLPSFAPLMDAHFHSVQDCTYLTGLYRHSTVLACCPPMPPTLARLHEQPQGVRIPDDYILASDDALQHVKGPPGPDTLQRNPCALPPGAYPILLPAPHRLVESYLRLEIQYRSPETRRSLESLLLVDERSAGGLDLDLLDPQIRKIWQNFKDGGGPVVEGVCRWRTMAFPPPAATGGTGDVTVRFDEGEAERDCYCDRFDCRRREFQRELDAMWYETGKLDVTSGSEGGREEERE